MKKYRFRIRTSSKAPLPVSSRGPQTACGTASAHPQDLLS
jgi:hypothetical protein